MKRSLIIIASLATLVAASAVRADNNAVFEDPYWNKRMDVSSSAYVAEAAKAPYDFLTDYNP